MEHYYAKRDCYKKTFLENYSALKEALSELDSHYNNLLDSTFRAMNDLWENAEMPLMEYMREEKSIGTLVEELVIYAENEPTDSKENVLKSKGIAEAILFKSVADYIPSDVVKNIKDRCKTIMQRSVPEERPIFVQMQQQSNQADTSSNHANNTQDAQDAKENQDCPQNILPTTFTDAEIKSAIKTLLDTKDENGQYIMDNKTQWWAVYQYLKKTSKIKIPQKHFAETINKWFPGAEDLRVECTQPSVSKKPQGASELPNVIADWSYHTDSVQYSETIRKQCRVVKTLCHIFSAQTTT